MWGWDNVRRVTLGWVMEAMITHTMVWTNMDHRNCKCRAFCASKAEQFDFSHVSCLFRIIIVFAVPVTYNVI